MVVSIHIGFRHYENKTISVIVEYTIKARQLNPTTVIYVLDVELLDGGEIKNWCIRFLVPISEACSTSFHDFLKKFILRVLISNYVLGSIGAFEVMVFQNRMDQLDFSKQQQTPLDMLRDFMIHKASLLSNMIIFCSVTLFSTMNTILQCSDRRKKTNL